MPKPVIGISENEFTRDEDNVFFIHGSGFKPGAGKPDPVVVLESTTHLWGPVTLVGKNPKWLCVRSTPTRIAPVTRRVTTSSDDITVTITFDPGLGTETDISITCEDVDYVDP